MGSEMRRWKVLLVNRVVNEKFVEIEAESPEDARSKALGEYFSGNFKWDAMPCDTVESEVFQELLEGEYV